MLVSLAFFILQEFIKADPHDYEWYIVGPTILLYFTYMWKIRSAIELKERRRLTGKTLAYWIALGITLFVSYAGPIPAKDYWSINLLFIVFTLLLADSYWDFEKITVWCMANKKDKC